MKTFDDNVALKWQSYGEWRDPDRPTRLFYVWEIRVCVVPKCYAHLVKDQEPDPSRAFFEVLLPPEGGLPEGMMMFPYQTFRYENAVDMPLEEDAKT